MKIWFKRGVLQHIVVFVVCFGIVGQGALIAAPGIDQLADEAWWQEKVQHQISETQNQVYSVCLFGDSISSGLGNSLGDETYNFAIGGLSSVSLIEQLRRLNESGVQCQKAIVAIGTNDAMYTITDEDFVNNMKQIVATIHSMGANDITLLPAFYSTTEASFNPDRAGTLERVDEISSLIQQVAVSENIAIATNLLEPLYRDRSLNEDLTSDGVHLNAEGRKIYRQLLLDLLKVN